MNDKRIFKLKESFEYGGVNITEVMLTTKLKGKHVKHLPEAVNTMADFFPFLGALGGYSEDFLDEIGFQDLQDMIVFAGKLAGNAPSATLTVLSPTSQ